MHCSSATYTAHVNDVHLMSAKCVSHITAQEIWSTRAKHTWTGGSTSLKNVLRTAFSYIRLKIGAKKQEIPRIFSMSGGRRCHAAYDLVLIWSTVVTSTVWKWLHSKSLRFCSSYFSGVLPGTRTQRTCMFDRTLLHANHYKLLLEAFLQIIDF